MLSAKISVRCAMLSACRRQDAAFRSLLGVAGFTLGVEEGLEINILGLNMGLDLSPVKLRLPFIGGVGSDNLQKNREGGEG